MKVINAQFLQLSLIILLTQVNQMMISYLIYFNPFSLSYYFNENHSYLVQPYLYVIITSSYLVSNLNLSFHLFSYFESQSSS